jgi:Serine/threonine protein kinase
MTLRLGSRYELNEVLGRGGSGEVWRGSSPEGDVAIKVLRPELSNDPQIVERFVAERSLLLGVQSPHVVAVHDLVIEGDRLAIVMDLVTGGDLRTRLRAERTLRPLTAVSLMIQVLEGLAAVHDAGIVHRDLKPENLLLDASDDSNIRVADFGIARLSSSTRTTRTTGLLGTPRYIAPELSIRGRVTPAVDVYAAGVTLYEMLFGRVPFDGPHPAAVLRAHAEDIPYRPEGVPDSLWVVIAAMLEKNPADRPTATEACERLRAVRTDVVTVAAFPAQPRAGGPDTDETYTTDPHGNATDLTGIGRRSRSRSGSAHADVPTRRRQRWLIPAVALAVVVAVIGVLLSTSGGDHTSAAPPYPYDGASPADAKVEHEWTFDSDRGDRLDGVMNVTPDTTNGFGDGSAVVSAFPSSVTNLHFTPSPAQRVTIATPAAGKAVGRRAELVRFNLPRGQHTFSVHYSANIPAAGTSFGRFDDLGWAMDKAYRVCYSENAPSICPVRDRPTRLTFTQLLAGPVGPDQTLDVRPYLRAATASGTTLTGGKLTGVRWSVDDGATARISRKGVLTGVSEGSVHVTARVGHLRTATPITVVVNAQQVPEIVTLSIDGVASTKLPTQYRATAKFDDGSVQDVTPTWTVSPITDATIDVNGVLLPLRADRTVHVRAETLSASGKMVSEVKTVHIGKFDGPPPTIPTTVGGCAATGSCIPPIDQCPSLPGVQTQPCPSPGDQCPDLPGVQTLPCPPADRDHDGIPDGSDACGGDPGPAAVPATNLYYTTLNGCPLPDLVITDFGPDNPNPVAGACVSFHVTITNQGGGPTPSGSPVHLGVLFVIDPGVRNDHIWWEDNNPQPLGAGESITRTSSGGNQGSCADKSKWSAVAGDHTIKAEVNDKSGDGKHLQIFESNFGNNIPATKVLHVG